MWSLDGPPPDCRPSPGGPGPRFVAGSGGPALLAVAAGVLLFLFLAILSTPRGVACDHGDLGVTPEALPLLAVERADGPSPRIRLVFDEPLDPDSVAGVAVLASDRRLPAQREVRGTELLLVLDAPVPDGTAVRVAEEAPVRSCFGAAFVGVVEVPPSPGAGSPR